MHHFATWVGHRHKGNTRTKPVVQCGTSTPQPKGESEKKKYVEATSPCHVDLGPADVSPGNSTSRSNDQDVSTCNDHTITGRPTSKSSDHSLVPHDPASAPSPISRADLTNTPSDALLGQRPSLSRLRRSKSLISTLSKKLRPRVRTPSTPPIPNNAPPAPTQRNLRQTTYRPQVVPVVLSDDPVSRERREAALRARGLLPPRQRDLSAIEADADRRIDALRKSDSSPPGSDNGRSDANEIAQAWRFRNSEWLSYAPSNSDKPLDPITQGSSPLDMPSHLKGSSELPTMRVDTLASIVLDGSSSISNVLLPGPLAHSLKAYSSRGSIGHQSSPVSRAASLSSQEPMPSSSNFEDPATGRSSREKSEDITTGSNVRAGLTIPAYSPLCLDTTMSDTFLASPTTPTLSPSVCYSSSETDAEDGLATTENGEHDTSPVSPTVKEVEGGFLCQETILEDSESLSDEDGEDQFHSPPNTALPNVGTHSSTDGHAAAPRHTPLLGRLKTKGLTLSAPRLTSPLQTSTSMVNLRRKMTGPLFGRPRRLSAVFNDSDATPQSPPPLPLDIKIYDCTALSAGLSEISDNEAHRLSELAFLT